MHRNVASPKIAEREQSADLPAAPQVAHCCSLAKQQSFASTGHHRPKYMLQVKWFVCLSEVFHNHPQHSVFQILHLVTWFENGMYHFCLVHVYSVCWLSMSWEK